MLEFHLSTILWTVINLLVLYLFLRKFLFGRINAVLEKREAMVKQNLDAAEESNQQAQAFKTKYEEKLTGAMQEADRIMAEAQNRAQRAYEARIAEAEKDAKQVRQEAEKTNGHRTRADVGGRTGGSGVAGVAGSSQSGTAVYGWERRTGIC